MTTNTQLLPLRPNRAIVQRLGAERYLLITLASFAASVILTRMFLAATGYPQIGGGGSLHIAHVLWGGLLLFIGGLLPLVLANSWAYTLAAVLNGAGMGLFIDEVGKFITQTNDYFYPAAAPIIYAFFLLTVMLYIYLRSRKETDSRHEMYQALHDLGEVLDNDLDADERLDLQNRLQRVVDQEPAGELGLLASSLLAFLYDEALRMSVVRLSFAERLRNRVMEYGKRVSRPLFRRLLIVLLIGGALLGLSRAWGLIYVAFTDKQVLDVVNDWLAAGRFQSQSELRWLFVRIALEGSFATLLIVAGALLVLRWEKLATDLGAVALTMLLTTVNLLVFYFDQFQAVITALAQYAILALLLAYRRLYLQAETPLPPEPKPGQWDDDSIRE